MRRSVRVLATTVTSSSDRQLLGEFDADQPFASHHDMYGDTDRKEPLVHDGHLHAARWQFKYDNAKLVCSVGDAGGDDPLRLQPARSCWSQRRLGPSPFAPDRSRRTPVR